MKPWEQDWSNSSSTASDKKPWEQDWSSDKPQQAIDNTNETLSIDTSAPQVIDNVSHDNGVVTAADNTVTTPTNNILADEKTNIDTYNANQEALKQATSQAQEQGDFPIQYNDNEGNAQTSNVPNQGLEDTSADMLFFPSSVAEKATYDNVVGTMIEHGSSSAAGLEEAVNLLARQKQIEPAAIYKSLEDVEPELKPLALAMQSDNNFFLKEVKHAVDDSITKANLGAQIVNRADMVKELAARNSDIKKAISDYGNMLEVAGKEEAPIKLTSIGDSLKYVDNLYGTAIGKAANTVNRLKQAAESSDTVNLAELLDLRKNVNRLAGKAQKGTDELKHWTSIRDSIDKTIESTTSAKPELQKLIKNTISNYARVVNNSKLSALVTKHTSGEGALNYGKLLSDVKKLGLNSPEVTETMKVVKNFSDKFKLDSKLGKHAIPGENQSSEQLYYGKALRWIVDNFTPWNNLFNRSRLKDLRIQKALRKAVNSSKSFDEFVTKFKTNKDIPEEVYNDFVKQIEYKPQAKTTGDVSLDKQYATSEGTISANASEATLHDAQTKLVRETLSKDYNDEVINKTTELLNSTRVKNIMKSTADRMKAEDIQGNMEMLQKTIKPEVDKIVSRINKDHGVKLPGSEVEKLYKQKLREMLKTINSNAMAKLKEANSPKEN